VKLVHLVGFITKKFVMMHGHMNAKKEFVTRFEADRQAFSSWIVNSR
jgi:amino acid permease